MVRMQHLLVLLILIPLRIFGQDMIILKDKTSISARVVQEDKQSVIYVLEENSVKSIKQINKDEIKKVKYQKTSKSVNIITIEHDSLTNEHLLNDVINHLIVSGYMIEEFDNKYYTVVTPWASNKRITVEVKGNKAIFRCFHREGDKSVYPHATAKVTWGIKPEPSEKRGGPGSSAFKDLEALCRLYLKNGHGTLGYDSEYIE
jgi:hypothetical protein